MVAKTVIMYLAGARQQDRNRELRTAESAVRADMSTLTARCEELERLRREESRSNSDKVTALLKEKDELVADVTVRKQFKAELAMRHRRWLVDMWQC
jgi:hypothetical protein